MKNVVRGFVEGSCHRGLDDLDDRRIDDGYGLHLGWSHHCNVGDFYGFGRGSRDVVGGDGVTVVAGLVFMGTVVDMVLDEFADLVLCVVSLFRRVCFSSSRNSERVLGSVGTSHSVYGLG